jgi:6-phosphogluconolactonase (cycloisomerase 2 family)
MHATVFLSARRMNRLLRNQVYRTIRTLPYPKFWAAASGHRIPDWSIAGRSTPLARPEGITFSPSGHMMAISNAGADSISLHSRIGARGAMYERNPSVTITDPEHLSYVHDTAFSPCGEMIAAAARESHAVSIFRINGRSHVAVEEGTGSMISGERSEVRFPAGVAYHPGGRWIAVANRKDFGITFYRITKVSERERVEATPFQSITEDELVELGLSAPHGLDFSPNGKFLAVAHDVFRRVGVARGESGISLFQCKPSSDVGIDPIPLFSFAYDSSRPHAVAFHPSGEYVAVAKQLGGVDVFRWRSEEPDMELIDKITIFGAGQVASQGVKGIAFTADGGQLAITTQLDEVLFYSRWG